MFIESRHSAGKRTIQARLRAEGTYVGLDLIRQLMKRQGLISKQPQKRHYYCTKQEQQGVFGNLLNRAFTPDNGTTLLCGDTTYININGEWHYLAIVMNLSRRQIVGWKLQRHHDAQLVIDALNQAMLSTVKTERMLFHSDQGSIYASEGFIQCVKQHGLTQSMSRKGNCWDNSPMERWFRSFKYEWMVRGGYASFESALDDIREYIFYYNHIRPHRYNQGFPPKLTKTTYQGLLN